MKSLYLISFMLLVSLISSAQVKYIGHRGASYYAPENSLGSLQLAWQLGADGAECDIYLTTDNQIVVWHDGNTARMTVDGTKMEVAKSPYSELKKLEIKLNPTNSPYYAGQHIALLKDVFKVMKKDELLVIELKSGKEIIPTLKKVVDKYFTAGKIAFIGFSFEAISAAKAAFPQTPCYWLSSKKEDVLKMIPDLKKNNLDGEAVYYTGGIYYMAGKDIEIGTYNSQTGKTTLTTDQLNNLAKQLFTGNNAGNKTKIAFCGSDAMEVLSNVTDASRKIIERDTVEKWNLKFKSFDTNFGEVLAIHHEFMDLNLKSDEMFIFDPAYLTKATFLSWGRTVIDFAKIGVRKSTGVVLQEASALYLRYPMAHARVKIATSPVAVTAVDLNKATLALAAGASEQLYAIITPADASNEAVTWASSATSKATVSASGVVTGVAAGTATITVTAVDTTGGTITDTCVVTVS